MLEFNCPSCSQRLTLDEAWAGKKCRCSVCNQILLTPGESASELGRLGGYRILQVLGAGGMGVVFQAEELRLKRMVALKTMLPALAASPENRRRFQQEAETAAAIEHDHIITIYQVGEDRGMPFNPMPLLQGESLEARLQRDGRLSVPEVFRFARETAAGLAVAHARGLIHRDIKPSNLWLECKGASASGIPAGH
jgi:serine/threonine protein kinase